MLLFVDDLVDALLLAEQHLPEIAGQAFNIGGGPDNTVSLLELIDADRGAERPPPAGRIRRLAGRRPALVRVGHRQIRPGDRVAAAGRRRRRASRLLY